MLEEDWLLDDDRDCLTTLSSRGVMASPGHNSSCRVEMRIGRTDDSHCTASGMSRRVEDKLDDYRVHTC